MQNNFAYNPYEVLQIDPNASIPEIKQAYLYVARMYHPDKGGDKRMFQFVQKAYRDILASRKGQATQAQQQGYQTGDFLNLRQGFQNYEVNLPQPETIMGTNQVNQEFNNNVFNDRFRDLYSQREQDSNEPDYTFDISEADYIERTRSDFDRENSAIEGSLASTARIFNQGAFDQNSFNRMFNWAKEVHQAEVQDLEEYHEPEAAIQGSEAIAFSEITDAKDTKNLSSLAYSDYQQVFNKSHRNPNSINKKMVDKFSRQRDITREAPIDQRKIRQRLNQYQGADFKIQKQGKVDFSRPIPENQLYTGRKKQYQNLAAPPGIAPPQNTQRQKQVVPQMRPTIMPDIPQNRPFNNQQQQQIQQLQYQQQQQYPLQQQIHQQQQQQQYPLQQQIQQQQPHQQQQQQQYQPSQQYPQQQQYPPQQQQQQQQQYPQQQLQLQYQSQQQQFSPRYNFTPTIMPRPQLNSQNLYQNNNNHQIQDFIPGQGGRMPPRIPQNSQSYDYGEASSFPQQENVEFALMQRIQDRNINFSNDTSNHNQMGNSNYPSEMSQYYIEDSYPSQDEYAQNPQYGVHDNQLISYNEDYAYEDPDMENLKNQMNEMKQTIDVQHKLLKKLATKKGYKIK